MMHQALQRIGLTDGEIKAYLALIEIGSSTTWKVTKRSGISGSKVYEVLDRLMKKGLVSMVVRNNVRHFEATPPERILDYIQEKENELKDEKTAIIKIMPELLLRSRSTPKSEVKVFMGFDGLKTANEDIIRSLKKGEEWLSMGLTSQPKSWEIHFNKRQAERAKKGIKTKHLINEKYKSLVKARKSLPHTEFRCLPKSFEMPTSTEIYKDKVAILILSEENPMAIVIESRPVAESFRKYFFALWENAIKA